MRHLTWLMVVYVITLAGGSLSAADLTKEQQEVWDTLEHQVGLFMKRDWEKHGDYIHPKAVFWTNDMPAPITAEMAASLGPPPSPYDKVLKHELTPLTVLVVNDVAIINFMLSVTGEKDGKTIEQKGRGHNTWKKDDGRWRLLAIYNESPKTKE